jgi:hypothetical protein
VAVVSLALTCLFLVGFGLHMMWHSTVSLPREYDQLEARGVPATAAVDKCARGLGGGHGVECRLRLAFHGSTRTWVYPENSRQFEGLLPGATVAMLVDPRDPVVAYSVTDVRGRTNAGFGIVAGFGVFFACLGAVGIGFLVWLALLRRRRARITWE